MSFKYLLTCLRAGFFFAQRDGGYEFTEDVKPIGLVSRKIFKDVLLRAVNFGQKKARLNTKAGFHNKSLAIPYFRMATCHTIIGAKRFHFRVRDGIGWVTLALFTKQNGCAVRHTA
jgi:hypothetical protein